MGVHLEMLENGVCVISMDDGENRFNPSFVSALDRAFDQVLQNPRARVVITVGGQFSSSTAGAFSATTTSSPSCSVVAVATADCLRPNKFYCNGLDLK